jgi:hypothetical protein
VLRYLGKNTQVRLVIFDSRPGLQAHTSATDILDQAGVGSENVLQRDYFVDFCRHAILLFGGLMQRPGGTPSSFFGIDGFGHDAPLAITGADPSLAGDAGVRNRLDLP